MTKRPPSPRVPSVDSDDDSRPGDRFHLYLDEDRPGDGLLRFETFLIAITGDDDTTFNLVVTHFPTLVLILGRAWERNSKDKPDEMHNVTKAALIFVQAEDDKWYTDFRSPSVAKKTKEIVLNEIRHRQPNRSSFILQMFIPLLQQTPPRHIPPFDDVGGTGNSSLYLKAFITSAIGSLVSDKNDNKNIVDPLLLPINTWIGDVIADNEMPLLYRLLHEFMVHLNRLHRDSPAFTRLNGLLHELPDSFKRNVLSRDDLSANTLQHLDPVVQAQLTSLNIKFPEQIQRESAAIDAKLARSGIPMFHKEAIKWMVNREFGIGAFRGGMLTCATGLGKEQIVVGLMHVKPGRTLILAPFGMIYHWIDELTRAFEDIQCVVWHPSYEGSDIYTTIDKTPLKTHVVLTTPHHLIDAFKDNPDATRKIAEFFARVVLDESQLWVRQDTDYTSFLRIIGHVDYRWVLNNPLHKKESEKDLALQLSLAGGTFDTLISQPKDIILTNEYKVTYGSSTRNLVTPFEKENPVSMTPIELEFYQTIEADVSNAMNNRPALFKLDEGVKLLRMAPVSLNMISDAALGELNNKRARGPPDNSAIYQFFRSKVVGLSDILKQTAKTVGALDYVSSKMEMAMNLINEFRAKGKGKILILSTFKVGLRRLQRLLQNQTRSNIMTLYHDNIHNPKSTTAPIPLVYGTYQDMVQSGEESLKDFEGHNGSVMGTTYIIASQRLPRLPFVDCIIELDPCLNNVQRIQAESCVLRVGNEQPATIYRLLCDKTHEVRINSLLKTRKLEDDPRINFNVEELDAEYGEGVPENLIDAIVSGDKAEQPRIGSWIG
jgi:hypothetical protein